MDIGTSTRDGILVLAPAGRLDTKTSHDFEKAVLDALGAGTRRFVVDLSELEYLSSAGLRVLLILARKLTGPGGYLAICSLNESVKAVFDVAGFTSVFRIFGSLDEAVAAAPSASEGPSALEQAATVLGLERSTKLRPETGDAELAARAARALGVKIP